ncbi:MAG TPA: nucleotide pyrophosphatase/phosphodiesterase family protein [Actinomycetales bacterium]|nr:nucleotide pyrophosphatase/phosphodiesterase family protein [Actinomycetales bacterium]
MSPSVGGVAPPYGAGTLSDLMPAVARALDVALPDDVYPQALPLDPSPRCCVMLVDGLGDTLLRERSGHAPYLRGRLDEVRTITAGFPTTTATSMGSLGTGRPPGTHGLVGYEVLVPELDQLLNELSWETPVDPRQWQPAPTVFQHVAADGVDVVRIGPAYFDGSGLTEAALRGGRFVAAKTLDERVDAALAALRSSPRALVYLYWGDVDKVGHISGSGSWEWGEELAKVDAGVRRLVAELPRDASLHVTADHGMVDVPFGQRIDVAREPELAQGVRHLGGEARCPQVYCEPGQAADVVERWQARLHGLATVMTRDEAVRAGLFGPVADHVRPRIGDLVVPCQLGTAVVDTATQRPELLRLVGLHGSLTAEESLVPLLSVRGSQGG